MWGCQKKKKEKKGHSTEKFWRHSGLIIAVWTNQNSLFLKQKLNKWTQRASEILCRERGVRQQDNQLCRGPSINTYKSWQNWRYLLWKRHTTNNGSESIKGRFSALMRQELNSLTRLPNALSSTGQVLLIASSVGKPRHKCYIFWDSSLSSDFKIIGEKSNTFAAVFIT